MANMSVCKKASQFLYKKIQIILIGINKIFTCGAQRTWDTACGQHIHSYISKANLLKLNVTLAVRNRHGIRHVANMSVRIKVSRILYKNPNNLNRFIHLRCATDMEYGMWPT